MSEESIDLTCPECGDECEVNQVIDEPEIERVAKAPERKQILSCPSCDYQSTKIEAYIENRSCPDCGSSENVVKREDEAMKTKIGYTLYCESCDREFVGKWK